MFMEVKSRQFERKKRLIRKRVGFKPTTKMVQYSKSPLDH